MPEYPLVRTMGCNRILSSMVLMVILISFSIPANAQDPSAPGPYAGNVMRAIYDFGDEAFLPSPALYPEPTGQPFPGLVEIRGVVHYPGDLTKGPFPLVLILHGHLYTCMWETTSFGTVHGSGWPCAETTFPEGLVQGEPFPSYLGYDYFAEHLAGHGYIVVSISSNGIEGRSGVGSDLTVTEFNDAGAQLVDVHLWAWTSFASNGGWVDANDPSAPSDLFVGAVDMDRIGTMGHSNGGSTVVHHYLRNRDLFNTQFNIRAVLPLASPNINRFLLDDVPIAPVVANCDAQDHNLNGVQFFDDARYSSESTSAGKHIIFMMGANHNQFNSEWFNFGDLTSNCFGPVQAMSREEQEGNLISYGSAFFRTYLGKETAFLNVLAGEAPTPDWTGGADVRVAYHAPSENRRDVNRFIDEENLVDSEMGTGTVSSLGLSKFEICGQTISEQNCLSTTPFSPPQHPHTVAGPGEPTVGQLKVAWDGSNQGQVSHAIPTAFENLTRLDALQFRAGVNYDESVAGQDLDFAVSLVDQQNRTATVFAASYAPKALSYPAGLSLEGNPLRLLLSTLRIPLDDFLDPAAAVGAGGSPDMTSIAEVRFNFGAEVASGGVQITDLAFSDKNFRDGLGVIAPGGGGTLGWLLDFNGDGASEEITAFGLFGDIPVSGDWDGDGIDGVGGVRVNQGGTGLEWVLNVNRTTPTASFETVSFGNPGDTPLAGDFNRDGVDDLVVYNEVGGTPTFTISFQRTHPGEPNKEIAYNAGLIVGSVGAPLFPILGDWDGDGRSDIAIAKAILGGPCSPVPECPFVWNIDHDLDGTIDELVFSGAGTLVPRAGDFDGNGVDDFAVFGSINSGPEAWHIDLDRDTVPDRVVPAIGPGLTPIEGNW